MKALLLALPFLIISCASSKSIEESEKTTYRPPPAPRKTYQAPQKPIINYIDLQAKLGITNKELGLQEKKFNTCQVGSGYSRTQNCSNLFFSYLRFRIQCRSTQGTVESVSNQELQPVSYDKLKWKLGLYAGRLRTTQDGYGIVRLVSPGPSRRQSFILKRKSDALQLQASGAKRIIVPSNWCY